MGKEVTNMSQILDRPTLNRERVEHRVPVRHRNPVIDYSLITVGAVVALVGVYFQFAPANWWLAHFAEAYHFGSYTLGALLMTAGFGVYADRTNDEDLYRSTRVTTGITLAVLAAVGAIVAVAFWLL
jgi:hypothetical protein